MRYNHWFEEHLIDTYVRPIYNVVSEYKPKTGLEIGFCWGMSAYAYLESTLDSGSTLISLDLDDNKGNEQKYKQVYADRWNIIYGNCDETSKQFENDSFDWINIDGDHSYDQVVKDINNTWRLLKAGGVMAFDDYGHDSCGVRQAVDEFAAKNNLTVLHMPNHVNGAVYVVKP